MKHCTKSKPIPALYPDDIIRFNSKTSAFPTKSGCLLWVGGKFTNGYGVFWARGRTLKAHRVAGFIKYGQIPDGFEVCHHCDVPDCVNPDHLFIGTSQDNHTDAANKGRHSCGVKHSEIMKRVACRGNRNRLLHPNPARGKKNGAHTHPERRARGEKQWKAVLKEADVIRIRKLRKEGVTYIKLAKRFGVSISSIHCAAIGKSWAHIPL